MTDDKQNDVHPFDVKYLRNLYSSLDTELKKQGDTLSLVNTHMATTTQILKSLEQRDQEHDDKIKEHAKRIHTVEMVQYGCKSETRLHGHDIELRRLNNFMIKVKQGVSGDGLSTGAIDVNSQRMQAAAEQAIRDSIPMKHHVWKMLPWIILTGIFCVVVTTLIMAGVATGKEVHLPEPLKIEGIEIKTNASSQKAKK